MRNHLLRATAGNKPAGGTDDNIANVELLLQGEGGSNGQANNAFVDSSASNHSITRNGDTTQGSFSPFSPKGWSGYFSRSSSDYLQTASSNDFNFGTGDFTVDVWVYPQDINTTSGSNYTIWDFRSVQTGNYACILHHSTNTFRCSNGSSSIVGTTIAQNNQWYHLAFVRESGTCKLFVNGVLENSSSSVNTNVTSNGGAEIGRKYDATNYFNGYISNLRVVTGTALYTSNFTPPTAPLTPVANTKLLTLQDNRFIDNSASNHSITVNGEPAIKPTSPFSGNREYQKASYFSGKFDGSGDYLSLDSHSDFAFNTGIFTVEAWVYSNGTQTSNACPISCGSSGSVTNTWQFDANNPASPNKWYFILGNQGSTSVESTNNVTHNQWTHIAVSRDSNNVVRLFIDGVLNDTATITNNLNAPGPLKIGVNRATSAYFDGYISNVRIIKGSALYTTDFTPSTTPLTPVTDTKVLTLQDYYLVDHSPNSHSITKYGDFKIVNDSPFSNNTYPVDTHVSWQFDGSNDHIEIPDVNFEKTSITQSSDLSGFSLAGDYSFVNSVLYFCRSANGINNSGSSFKWQTARRFDKNWSIQVRVGNGNPTHSYIEKGFQIGFATSNSTTYHGNGLSLEPQSTRKYSIELTCYGTNSTYIKLYDGSSSTAIASSSNIVNTMPLVGEYDYWFDYDHSASTIKIYQANSGGTKPSTPKYTFNNVVFDDTELYTSIGAGHNGYYKADWTLKQWILDDGTGEDFSLLDNFTFEAWVYRTSDPNPYSRIANWGNYWGNNTAVSLLFDDGDYPDKVTFRSYSGITLVSNNTVSSNQWYHIAVSKSGPNYRLFVNGVLEASSTTSTTITSSAATTLTLGGCYDRQVEEPFAGYISNARFVKGIALYIANFNVPTEPLTAVPGTTLLTLQSGTLVDNSASGHAFTNNGAAVTEVSPFGAALIDRAGSMYFGGSWDYIRHSSYGHSDFAFGTGDFTVEGWVYPIGTNGNFFDTRTTLNDCGYGFGIGDGSSSGPSVWDGCGSSFEIQTNTIVPRQQWTHVAFVRKSSTLQVFVNGVSAGTVSTAGRNNNVGGCIVATNANTLYQTSPTPSGAGLKGYIADLRVIKGTAIYTSNFTPPTAPLQRITNTVLLLQGNNGAIEDSLGKRTFTTSGNAQIDTTVKKFGSGAIEFDGTLDYLTATDTFDFSGDWTVEFWFYRKVLNNSEAFFIQAGPNWNWTSTGIQFAGWVDSNNLVGFNWFNGTAESYIISTSTVSINTWHYYVAVREGSQISLYLDGQRIGTSTSGMGTMSGSIKFGIGSWRSVNTTQPETLNGYIDDFRITTGVARYDPTQTTHDIPSTTHPTE